MGCRRGGRGAGEKAESAVLDQLRSRRARRRRTPPCGNRELRAPSPPIPRSPSHDLKPGRQLVSRSRREVNAPASACGSYRINSPSMRTSESGVSSSCTYSRPLRLRMKKPCVGSTDLRPVPHQLPPPFRHSRTHRRNKNMGPSIFVLTCASRTGVSSSSAETDQQAGSYPVFARVVVHRCVARRGYDLLDRAVMPTEVLEVELLPDEGGVRRHLLAVERCGEAERRRGGEKVRGGAPESGARWRWWWRL